MSSIIPPPLTRREASKFLPDHRSIRAFEELFTLLPIELDNINNSVKGISFPDVLFITDNTIADINHHIIVASTTGLINPRSLISALSPRT